MILELVEFDSPAGWTREQVVEDARHVVPKWQTNRELLRKHFLLSDDGRTGAGVYIWPSVADARKAHNEEWRQAVIKRSGGPPRIRYFDLLLLVDNENGLVIEYADGRPVSEPA